MTVYIRTSPPSPVWQIKFKLPKMAKAVRQSSEVVIDLGKLTLEQADELRRAGKMTGALKASYLAALKVEDKLRAEHEARVEGRFTKATLAQATDDFFDNVISVSEAVQKAERRGVTDIKMLPVVRNWFSAQRRLHRDLGKDTVLDDITDEAVLAWRNAMRKSGMRVPAKGKKSGDKATLSGKGLSIGSCNAYLRVLSSVLNTANKARKMMTVPAIPYYEEAESQPKCLDIDDVKLVMDAAAAYSPRVERVLTFLFNIGSRKTETFLLTWKNIDLTGNGPGWVHFPAAITKTGEPRSVPMPEHVRIMLQDMKREQQLKGYTGNRVFAYQRDGRQDWEEPTDIDEAVKSLQAAVDMPDFTLHVCRHTYASALLRRGVRLIEVSKLLGHADYETTVKTYAFLENNNLEQAVAVLATDYAGVSAGARLAA